MLDKWLLITVALVSSRISGNQEHSSALPFRIRSLLSSASVTEENDANTDGIASIQSASRSRRRRKKGRLSFDLHGSIIHIFSSEDSLELTPTSYCEPKLDEVSLLITPASAIRLVKILLSASGAVITAFMGTLRLLAPLILARRAINSGGELVFDYMRGRYIRTTYSRLENLYMRYYELPAVFRAFSRTVAQVLILSLLSYVISSNIPLLPGFRRPFDPPGCWWSAILCISLTVGGGYLGSSALAVWGGPLRIQVNASHQSSRNLSRVFTRPWHILQWMQDPEEWITTISSTPRVQPFAADPILFPATWAPLRLMLMLGVAQASFRPHVMRLFWLHAALADEWYRTLVSERRVALGLCAALCYLICKL